MQFGYVKMRARSILIFVRGQVALAPLKTLPKKTAKKRAFIVFFKHFLRPLEMDLLTGEGLIRKKTQNCI